jgi:hypothetical protein
MTDTPKRLYGPAQLAASAATVYTVPASTTTILRYIRIINTTSTDRTVTVSIGVDAADTRIFSAMTVPANGGAIDWAGSVPMTAGEVIQAYASAASALTTILAGVEVT